MTIIFVRHGETALNASRTMQPADTPLSERGIAQARHAAARLRAFKPVAIVSSDMPRALRTAQEIALETGLNPSLTQLLHERNFGDLRGKPHDSFGFDPIAMPDAPPNGESMAEFTERCRQAFECTPNAPHQAVRVNCAAHLDGSDLAEPSRSLSGG